MIVILHNHSTLQNEFFSKNVKNISTRGVIVKKSTSKTIKKLRVIPIANLYASESFRESVPT